MSKIGKILGTLLAILLVLVLVTGGGAYLFIRRSFSTVNGTIQVTGLQAQVTIIRDRWGVPHIYAENNHDLFFAQGYVHAQDRLWQMEFSRRIASGTLSEILGNLTIDTDKFLRTVGLRRAAEKDWEIVDTETRQVLQDYAAGINAFIESHHNRLPIEFTLLGSKPAPWTPQDTLAWGKVMCLDLGGNYKTELLRAKLIAHLGEEKVQDLMPPYPDGGPFIIPPQARSYADLGDPSLKDDAILSWLSINDPGIGSNNWVVDGSLTASGQPLLANDPHLGIQLPSIWYEMGLHGGDFNVVGATFPGVPTVVIGHNAHIAWGVTNVGPDVQDLYLEKTDDPDNPTRYEFMGQWKDIEIITEEIRIKDQDSINLQVRLTQHGPLLNDVIEGLEQPTALRWTALDAMHLTTSLTRLNIATDWETFRKALRYWDAPSQNFVYADTKGNIGYQTPGRIPIRAKGDGTVPVPGWTGEYEWVDYIPFEELPSVYNPPNNLIVTANNKVVPDDYPYFISSQWAAGYRAQRITDLLTNKAANAPLTPDDMRDIQADIYSLPGESLVPYILEAAPENKLQESALEQIRTWDHVNGIDSPGAAIMAAFYQEVARAIFADELGKELFGDYGTHLPAIKSILADAGNPWLDDVTTPETETRPQIVQRAFAAATNRLSDLLGDNPAKWAWGEIHTATFIHNPLGQSGITLLERLVNKGPFPMGGSGYTVNANGYSSNFKQRSVPSYRQIIDLNDWTNSRSQHTVGQSGQPLHKHYADMIQPWRAVEHHPMLFTRQQVETEKEATLLMQPGQ